MTVTIITMTHNNCDDGDSYADDHDGDGDTDGDYFDCDDNEADDDYDSDANDDGEADDDNGPGLDRRLRTTALTVYLE